jgi:hypothetical protein
LAEPDGFGLSEFLFSPAAVFGFVSVAPFALCVGIWRAAKPIEQSIRGEQGEQTQFEADVEGRNGQQDQGDGDGDGEDNNDRYGKQEEGCGRDRA